MIREVIWAEGNFRIVALWGDCEVTSEKTISIPYEKRRVVAEEWTTRMPDSGWVAISDIEALAVIYRLAFIQLYQKRCGA